MAIGLSPSSVTRSTALNTYILNHKAIGRAIPNYHRFPTYAHNGKNSDRVIGNYHTLSVQKSELSLQIVADGDAQKKKGRVSNSPTSHIAEFLATKDRPFAFPVRDLNAIHEGKVKRLRAVLETIFSLRNSPTLYTQQ